MSLVRQPADTTCVRSVPGSEGPAQVDSPVQHRSPASLDAEASTLAAAYHRLSCAYASNGDSFAAIHTAWLADMHTVQSVLWRHLLVAVPRVDQTMAAITTTVGRALTSHLIDEPSTEPGDARHAVLIARDALTLAFNDNALHHIEAALLPLDHLLDLPAPPPGAAAAVRRARTGDIDPATVALARWHAARDGIAVALAFEASGLRDDALDQAWKADWAALESYLLEAALAVGDASLITVEMRWALVRAQVTEIPALPSGFTDAVAIIRTAMAGALGSIEGRRLAERFAPLT
jgi:hypothetical protein